MSDFDFLLVHEPPVPPIDEAEFVSIAESWLPHPTIYALTYPQYQVLETSLGRDFTGEAVCLNHDSLPDHDQVTLTPRDAYEIFIYALADYQHYGVTRNVLGQNDSLEFLYAASRIQLNALRSVAILSGAYNYHDTDGLPPVCAELVRPLLEWRDNARAIQLKDLTTFFETIRYVFGEHARAGEGHDNSIEGTEYEGKPGAQFVSFHQNLVVDLMRTMSASLDDRHATPELVAEAEAAAWDVVLSRHPAARATLTPEDYFLARRPCFQDQLLLMKTQVK